MDVIDQAAVDRRPALAQMLPVASIIGAAAVIWFTLLSGWLGIAPGSVLVKRQNVLFNSDTNSWIDEMVHTQEPSASTRAVHPLQVFFWQRPTQALLFLFRMFLPREQAGLLAARVVVASIAGAGVGFLALFALACGVELAQCLLLFSMYFLFTSNSTIALPEHFGVSNGLLSIAFVIPTVVCDRRLRRAILTVFVLLCGGTTLTNALYPLASLYQYGLESVRTRRIALAAASVMLGLLVFLFVDSQKVVRPPVPGVTVPLGVSGKAILPAYFPAATRWYSKTTMLHSHILDYANLRLLHLPSSAAKHAAFALIAPAVGPPPLVQRTKGSDMVTYESGRPLHWSRFGFTGSDDLDVGGYWRIQGLGAVAWTLLLLLCSYHALRDTRTRSFVWLPLGWIAFSVVFHNLWGDELFLYAAHWSWALMALVLLGARHLSIAATAAFAMPILVSQISTLFQIRNALLTIVQ